MSLFISNLGCFNLNFLECGYTTLLKSLNQNFCWKCYKSSSKTFETNMNTNIIVFCMKLLNTKKCLLFLMIQINKYISFEITWIYFHTAAQQ